MIGRHYPLLRPEGDDARFTFGLLLDIAEQLTAHGYAELTAEDFVALQQAVFAFLYETPAATS